MGKTISIGDWDGAFGGVPVYHDLPCSTVNFSRRSSRYIEYIVMHYTGNAKDSAKNNANYFHNNNVGASAHFFVDEVSAWQSVGLRDMAWHVGNDFYAHPECRNTNSIGIEMCTSGNYRIAAKTVENAAQLCAGLCVLLGIGPWEVDKYVLRHWDVTYKNCPAQFAGENNQEWAEFKAQVKSILRQKEEPELTKKEVEALFEQLYNAKNPTYNALEQVPDYWRGDIQAMMKEGIIKGSGDKLGLTRSECKAAVIAWRGLKKLQ